MQGTNDLERMMSDVLDCVLSIFDCDRAFLIYPCDSAAESWFTPMERTKPAYPGLFEIGIPYPMSPPVQALNGRLLGKDEAADFLEGREIDPNKDPWKTFEIRSLLAIATYPKVGKPWMFGVHQCSYAREWTPAEMTLFREISRRLADGLTTLMMYRDLKRNQEFLDTIVENLPSMVSVKDAETLRWLKVNRAGEQLLHHTRDELLGKLDAEVFAHADAESFAATDREAVESGRLVDLPEQRLGDRLLHTKKIPIRDETGKPKYLLGIAEDITERRRLEEQLRHSHKMESIGRLAGGVAHDYNNMLGVILGNTELALRHEHPGTSLFNYLQAIRTAAQRSAELTKQLLAFARRQPAAPKVVDLNQILTGMINMLRVLIGEHLELIWRPGPELWPIHIDPSQLDQILANLCLNARDAIEDVGSITIETANCTRAPNDKQPGDFVLLSVRDTGRGMAPATLPQIFEPFFTTKERGKGTGLGLATVHGIVTQNGGFIDVNSGPEHGTTFRIYLPRQLPEAPHAQTRGPSEPVVKGKETILIVEDEPGVLAVTRTMLESFGYRVLTAGRPEDALTVAEQHGSSIHLMVTDVIMPGMNGAALASTIAARYPSVRCLFMSAYTDDLIAQHGVLRKDVHFIQKPFSMLAFALKVREVLDAPVTTPDR